jgi:autotransporter-associated beta strand protein
MSFGTMNDGGNQMTLLGGGTSTSVTTGPLNGFTATGSSFTGSLVLGNSAGTQGALYAPSSLATTAITTGNITVNRYSQLLVNNTGSFGAAGSTLTLNGIGNQTDAGSGNSGSIRTTASGTTTWLGSTVLGSNTVVSPTTGNTLVLNGNVSGAFQLNKAGSGTLTFNGTNASNTGSTWLTNGTITVNAGSAMGSGALKIGDDSGSNNVTLNLNNSAQAIGTLTQGSASVTRTINLGTSTALTITQTAAGTYGGTITGATGSVSLGASSSNSLTFSASNSYGGGSTISGGTLTLGHATNTLANTGAVLVNGGILNVANPDTVGAVTLSSGSISGAGTLTGSSYALTNIGSVSAILAGTGTLTKTGTGTATISSANTYTGGTTLSGGSLNITNISASATGTGNVVIQDTATLQGSGRIAPTTGGTIIVQDGGTVAIGDLNGTPAQGAKILTITPATGTITTTLQTASTIRFDLFTNAGDNTAITSAADLFRTGGNLTFQDGVILSVNKSGTFSFADGDKWRLLDWTTFSGSITGTSSALTLDLPTLDGLFWDVSALYTNGSISVSGIPEPSRTLFLALGLLTLTLRRRR